MGVGGFLKLNSNCPEAQLVNRCRHDGLNSIGTVQSFYAANRVLSNAALNSFQYWQDDFESNKVCLILNLVEFADSQNR